jgi:Wings apart-like protein regulation of heterochromatin
MFLQDDKVRRRPLVYGRAKRSALACNVFDLEEAGSGRTQRSSTRKDEARTGQQHIHGQVSMTTEKTPNGKLSDFRHRRTSTQKPTPTILSTREDSSSKNDRDQPASAFDLPSDEEGANVVLFEKSMQKRRRLTPVRNQGSNINQHQRRRSGSSTNEGSVESSQSSAAATSKGHAKTSSISRTRRLSPRRTRTPAPEVQDGSSRVALCNTPKQTRLLSNLLDSTGLTDSPSKLFLTSLRLTNGDDSGPRSVGSALEPLPRIDKNAKSVPKPKARLIDAMVSPRKRLPASLPDTVRSFTEEDDVGTDGQPCTAVHSQQMNHSTKMDDVDRSKSSTSLSTSGRPRVTYSRERSHLADMLTEDLLEPASQPSSQEACLFGSQNAAIYNSFKSIRSHQDSEEEQEQEVPGIRSIHELRHSGGTARSRVDLETILEDIEATGPSSRSRGLHGLCQLVERLGDPEVGRHIADQSLDQRLSQCLHLDGDIVGQTLMIMVMSRLIVGVQLPIASLKRVFDALARSGTNMLLLQESRNLASIVRDRKQNLSKVSCREITALIGPFRSSAVWPHDRPTVLTPRLTLIRSMDIVLRQARQLGDFSMVLPSSIFSRLLQLLLHIAPDQLAQLSNGKDNEFALVMDSTVSIIESLTISKSWAENGCLEVAKKLSGLGPLLDRLAVSSADSSDRTYHLILRLILNITNNDSDLCDAFSVPALVDAIFGLVSRDFLQTSMLTKAGLQESTLEGVILALGALSNLAEHSSSFRRAMLHNSLSGKSMVDWITLYFRDQVEVASEVRSLHFTGYSFWTDAAQASSVEQTVSLVAFGYLSVLLCNLCLDRQIRNRVRGLLQGGTLQTLLLFVQEFLGHFRRAEELDSKQGDEETTMRSGFVGRFEGVLDTLRQAEESR